MMRAETLKGGPEMEIDELARVNVELFDKTPAEIDAWAVDRFKRRVVMGIGFSRNTLVQAHRVHLAFPWMTAIFVDPGDTPESNFKYAKAIAEFMPDLKVKRIDPVTPLTELERQMIAAGGDKRREVYKYRKIEPMDAAIEDLGAEAILYGNRFDQNEQRARFPLVSPNAKGIVRVYSSLYTDEEAAAQYLYKNELPVHPDGYPGGIRFSCGLHDDVEP